MSQIAKPDLTDFVKHLYIFASKNCRLLTKRVISDNNSRMLTEML